MSRRTERVASVIRDVLAQALHAHLNDPRIETLTSITKVEVAPDFSTARVFVSVMAAPARQQLTLTALRHAAGRLRCRLASEITLRTVPQLQFRLDESLQGAFRTVQMIDEAMAELGQPVFAETQAEGEDAVGDDKAGDAGAPRPAPDSAAAPGRDDPDHQAPLPHRTTDR